MSDYNHVVRGDSIVQRGVGQMRIADIAVKPGPLGAGCFLARIDVQAGGDD